MRHDPSTVDRKPDGVCYAALRQPAECCNDRAFAAVQSSRARRDYRTEGDPISLAPLVLRIAAAACREAHGRWSHLPIDPDQALREQVGPNRVIGGRRERAPLQPTQRGIFVIVQAERASHNPRSTRALRRDTSTALCLDVAGRQRLCRTPTTSRGRQTTSSPRATSSSI